MDRPRLGPRMQRLSTSKVFVPPSIGVSTYSTSRPSMKHGSPNLSAILDPQLTKDTGVLSPTNVRLNGPSAAKS